MSLQTGIVEVARACIDTPFRHQGRIAGKALDCAGLCIVALRANGVDVRDVHGYGRVPIDGRLKKAIDAQPAWLEPIAVKDADAGDIVLIRIGVEPSHVGILSGNGYIIHAYERIGRVVEHRLDNALQLHVVAAWRARGEA